MHPTRIDVELEALRIRGSDSVNWRLPPDAQVAHHGQLTLLVLGHPRVSEPLNARELLAEIAMRGPACLSELKGSYAIALIDSGVPSVTLQVDRMSRFTWCYVQRAQTLSFSTRADLIADGAALRAQALFAYLSEHVIASPDTVFEGVYRLPAASRLVFNISGIRVQSWWQPRFQSTSAAPLDTLSEEFREILRRSVAQEAARFEAGRCGSFLSGGTDSSTISGLLRQASGHRTRAYSIGFDADGYDEMSFARIAARHFDLDHREHYLSPAEVTSGMPLVAASYDQPFGNSSAVAAYHCARIAREEGCSALLAGDGGDELFGGNARYAKQSIFGWYDHVPATLRHGMLEPVLGTAAAARLPGVAKVASYVRQARVPMPDRMHMYNLLRHLGLSEVLCPAFLAAVRPEEVSRLQSEVYAQTDGEQMVNRMLAYDWRFTLADNDLPKVIGTSTLAGMEVGFPMLDDDLIDFSLRVPAGHKIKRLQLRWFFKQALRGFLPEPIITKKKQGFGLPFGVWALRDAGLARLADDALSAFSARGVVAPSFMTRLRKDLLPSHPGYFGELVWVITMLELWLQRHRPDYRAAT
jgi:asparagine synthase (glutamine-hydrolysing)